MFKQITLSASFLIGAAQSQGLCYKESASNYGLVGTGTPLSDMEILGSSDYSLQHRLAAIKSCTSTLDGSLAGL